MPRGVYDRSKAKKNIETQAAPKPEKASRNGKTVKVQKALKAKSLPISDLGAKTSFLLENIQTLAGVVVESLKVGSPTGINIKAAADELNTQLSLLVALRQDLFGHVIPVTAVATQSATGLPAMTVPPGHPAANS